MSGSVGAAQADAARLCHRQPVAHTPHADAAYQRGAQNLPDASPGIQRSSSKRGGVGPQDSVAGALWGARGIGCRCAARAAANGSRGKLGRRTAAAVVSARGESRSCPDGGRKALVATLDVRALNPLQAGRSGARGPKRLERVG